MCMGTIVASLNEVGGSEFREETSVSSYALVWSRVDEKKERLKTMARNRTNVFV